MIDSKKIIVLGIILLFLGLNVIPLAESTGSISSIVDSQSDVYIVLEGVLGDNDWFISCVTVIFVAEGDVAYIMYKLDGDDWQEYTGSFEVCEDGEHIICWYWVDSGGNESDIKGPLGFKIDQTDPTIDLTAEKISFNTWLFIADVYDETSGINRVEFYVDKILIGTAIEEPYEWEWSGMGNGHVVDAIVYDNAGNLAVSIPQPPPTPTRVFGIIRNPKFTEETVSFFAIIVISNTCFPYIFRQITFQNDYSGYVNDRFIFAVFEYGPC